MLPLIERHDPSHDGGSRSISDTWPPFARTAQTEPHWPSAVSTLDIEAAGTSHPSPASIDYLIEPHRSLVRARMRGVITMEDLFAYYQRLAADPHFDPSFRQLTDARELTNVTAGTGCIRSGAHHQLFARGVRRAIVVSTDLQFGIARMFASFAADVEQDVRVFRGMDAAAAWLRV
jgi:hypothetical protein